MNTTHYTINELRQIAVSGMRGTIRARGDNPDAVSADDALDILDDMCRLDPALLMCVWYLNASETQLKKFEKEWRQYSMRYS